MDNKTIVDKVLAGGDYAELVKDLDIDQQRAVSIEISNAAKEAANSELEKIKARKLELERLSKKEVEVPTTPKPNNEVAALRAEQLEKARSKFFNNTNFKLEESEIKTFDEAFSKIDSGKFDSDLIVSDMRKAYALIKSDTLLDSVQRVKDFEKNASNFNAMGANVNYNQPTPEGGKYSQEAKKLHQEWQKAGINKTLDDAQRVASSGLSRKL